MTKYELDQMPVTETGQRMYSRVSPIYENSRFMKTFYDALGAEWEPIRKLFTTLREQHFIETVDWGITFLEEKYSLEPRPDLSLEERRARLGIKARKHLPLNPGVMEKYILDSFGLKTYLSEEEPGYIHVITNHLTEDGWGKMITWLLKEKPAHLMLDVTQYEPIYTGTNPDETEPPEDKVFLPSELDLPKTPADKKRFKRIFAGCVLAEDVNVAVDLYRPKSAKHTIYAGNMYLEDSKEEIRLREPKSTKVKVHVGCPFVMFEHVLINAKDMPLLRPIKENPIADLAIANVAIGRGNNYVAPPDYDFLKIFFTFPATSNRRYITLKHPRDGLTRSEIKAVADYAVDNELLLNTEQNVTDDAPRADLITKKITTLI